MPRQTSTGKYSFLSSEHKKLAWPDRKSTPNPSRLSVINPLIKTLQAEHNAYWIRRVSINSASPILTFDITHVSIWRSVDLLACSSAHRRLPPVKVEKVLERIRTVVNIGRQLSGNAERKENQPTHLGQFVTN
jgi:hypothetical protein